MGCNTRVGVLPEPIAALLDGLGVDIGGGGKGGAAAAIVQTAISSAHVGTLVTILRAAVAAGGMGWLGFSGQRLQETAIAGIGTFEHGISFRLGMNWGEKAGFLYGETGFFLLLNSCYRRSRAKTKRSPFLQRKKKVIKPINMRPSVCICGQYRERTSDCQFLLVSGRL